MLGERLKQFAKDYFGGISNLATAINMKQPQLSQYVTGERRPGADVLEKLRKSGCDINWLLTGEASSKNTVNDTSVAYGKNPNSEHTSDISTAIQQLREEVKELKAELYDSRKDKTALEMKCEELEEENRRLRVLNAKIDDTLQNPGVRKKGG